MHFTKVGRFAAIGASVACLSVGGAAMAGAIGRNATSTHSASSHTSQPADQHETDHEKDGPDHDKPAYTSSVVDLVGISNEAKNIDETDAAEAARIAKLAKITPAQAQAAASAKVPGKVSRVELDSSDGNVVYEVEIMGSNKIATEVTVDAGNAKILEVSHESADDAHESADDAHETDTETAGHENGDAEQSSAETHSGVGSQPTTTVHR